MGNRGKWMTKSPSINTRCCCCCPFRPRCRVEIGWECFRIGLYVSRVKAMRLRYNIRVQLTSLLSSSHLSPQTNITLHPHPQSLPSHLISIHTPNLPLICKKINIPPPFFPYSHPHPYPHTLHLSHSHPHTLHLSPLHACILTPTPAQQENRRTGERTGVCLSNPLP